MNFTDSGSYKGGVSDNATIMIMNLLIKCGVKKAILAGFDGFSLDVDANYFDDALKRPVKKEQADIQYYDII